MISGLDIFISYSTKDKDVFHIRDLKYHLQTLPEVNNAYFWETDVEDNIYAYMEKFVPMSKIMIVMCSPNYSKSKACQDEWQTAARLERQIIPVFTSEDHIPTMLKNKVGVRIDFFADPIDNIIKIGQEVVRRKNILEEKDNSGNSESKISQKASLSGDNNDILVEKYNFLIDEAEKHASKENYEKALQTYNKALDIARDLMNPELLSKTMNIIDKTKEDQSKKTVVDFHGVNIVKIEYDVIKALEEYIGDSIPVIPENEKNDYGFGLFTFNNHIVWLGLRKKKLTSLPESIGSLKSLETLSLWGNRLTSLPESIGSLKSLTRLNLDHNELSSLPESIGSLKSLTYLDLNYNKISFLPESIGSLKSLTCLNLYDNKISFLPESIGSLTALTKLDLFNNQLSSLSETIGSLKSLKELNLSCNNLSSLPESIGSLTELTILRLDTNKLFSLPESIGSLKSLKKLTLGANELDYLPENIKKQLEILKKYGCNIFRYWWNSWIV